MGLYEVHSDLANAVTDCENVSQAFSAVEPPLGEVEAELRAIAEEAGKLASRWEAVVQRHFDDTRSAEAAVETADNLGQSLGEHAAASNRGDQITPHLSSFVKIVNEAGDNLAGDADVQGASYPSLFQAAGKSALQIAERIAVRREKAKEVPEAAKNLKDAIQTHASGT